jgi:cyclic pyranopterin phosphate synthase
MGYEIVAGRIVTWSLEIHPVDHCNLRCVQCCTMSPALPAAFADPEQIAADLALLAPVLRPNLVKLTGGEPLLHPRLVEILAAVRASGVSDQIQVTTNGHLLKRQPEAFWRAIDRLTVSWYSSRPLPEGFIAWVRAEADRYGVLLQVKPTSAFQRITPDAPLDEAGAHASFAGCWMKDRCHLVHQGRFYRCTRPPHLAQGLPEAHGAATLSFEGDGVELAAPDLRQRLAADLQREAPLRSCRHCLGNRGDLVGHAQAG